MAITVRDDGRGFNLEEALERAAKGHHLGLLGLLGLLGMREPVKVLGGRFEVETERGSGTTVHAWVPLGETAAAE